MNDKVTETFSLGDIDPRLIFGQNDKNLRTIERAFPLNIVVRGDKAIIEGDATQVKKVTRLFHDLLERVRQGEYINDQYLNYSIESIMLDGIAPAQELGENNHLAGLKRPFLKPKTIGQRKYLDAILNNDIVFSIGPAGTGKTYLAVGEAVAALKDKRVNRIVLVRPAVEAGESLGFLPGDIRAKVDPYLRPVYDALHNMLPPEKIQKYIELGVIEIVPLAFMRGRTLDKTFVILDEAQNTTPGQMKMFLTRLGADSKAVITGDITQIDLAKDKKSGLIIIQGILVDIEGIEFVYLSDRDVVRHPLVQKIIRAYEGYERNLRKESGDK